MYFTCLKPFSVCCCLPDKSSKLRKNKRNFSSVSTSPLWTSTTYETKGIHTTYNSLNTAYLSLFLYCFLYLECLLPMISLVNYLSYKTHYMNIFMILPISASDCSLLKFIEPVPSDFVQTTFIFPY